MNFIQKLNAAVIKSDSRFCLGLDPQLDKLPPRLHDSKTPFFDFNKAIIDATHDLVCAYKPNSAFYEARGAEGISEFKMTCDYLKEKYPDVLIFLDAKRADIGNTNKRYVEYAYDYLNADAITLHPYVGSEGLEPFLERKDKGCIILCRTSNKGSKEFQNLMVGGKTLYQVVAHEVAKKWNKDGNCMLVVGATYPQEMTEIRAIDDEIPFLIPGIGAQGGDLEGSVKAGLNSKKEGIVISTSRVVLYASQGDDFAQRAREETKKLKDAINEAIKKAS